VATKKQKSAKAIIDGFLSRYGLASVSKWAWGRYLDGAPIEQVMLEIRDRPEYKTRFPYMEALAKKGRAISEEQAIEYEQRASQLMRSYGLPRGFYDNPDDFAKIITAEVGLPELEQRLRIAQTAAFNAPAELRGELQRLYGISAGDLTAYWIDPGKALPVLEQRFAAAQIGASSRQTGWGKLGKDEAERLAALGVDGEQARAGFSELTGLRELTLNLPGQGRDDTSRADLVAARFEGDADAARRIRRTQERRVAPFQAGGGFTSTEDGFTGVGTARGA
jgi:hypothetical protein